jgi:hypothetical protein
MPRSKLHVVDRDGFPEDQAVWQINVGEEPDRAGEWVIRLSRTTRWNTEFHHEPGPIE